MRIEPVDKQPAEPVVRRVYDAIERQTGRVSNGPPPGFAAGPGCRLRMVTVGVGAANWPRYAFAFAATTF
jgi:hypothetical protein